MIKTPNHQLAFPALDLLGKCHNVLPDQWRAEQRSGIWCKCREVFVGNRPRWKFTKPRSAEFAAESDAVLLRSNVLPAAHIGIISIATMIIDRLHLDPVSLLPGKVLPGGSASPDSGQFWVRFTRFRPTGNLLQLLPIVPGSAGQLESSFSVSSPDGYKIFSSLLLIFHHTSSLPSRQLLFLGNPLGWHFGSRWSRVIPGGNGFSFLTFPTVISLFLIKVGPLSHKSSVYWWFAPRGDL